MSSASKVAAENGGKEKKKSPAKVKSAQGNTKKKLSSLSSFQPQLTFRHVPNGSTSKPSTSSLHATASSSPSGSSTKARSPLPFGSSNQVKDKDLMPPPPVGLQTKSKFMSSTSTSKGSSDKGKQREVEVVVIDDSDEEMSTAKVGSSKPSARSVVRKEISRKGMSEAQERRGETHEIWTERYAPKSERDLAPGKARIERVKTWLSESVHGHPPDVEQDRTIPQTTRDKVRKYRRILLLTGPSGTGKTTTVQVLAEEMGLDLVEWGEGIEERSIGSGFERDSPISKLTSWLARHSYIPLQHSSTSAGKHKPQKIDRKRVLLITSLPTLSHLPTRDAFHEALLSFCSTYTSSSCPLIIIHSDVGLGGKAEESWMERDRGGREGAVEVVGKAIRDGPYCTEIDFLPLAPTFMVRALQRVLDLTNLPTENKPPKSALQLIALTSNGDLRSAINSLQFLCGRKPDQLPNGNGKRKASKDHADDGDDDVETNGKARKISRGPGKGSRGGKGAKLDVSSDLRAVLDAVTRREQSLGLFHALGKVFYNKRLGDPPNENDDQEELAMIRSMPTEDALPPHLKNFERSRSRIMMDSFIPTIPIDASSFALWIHQSLPSFCQEIEQVSMAFDDLCAADIMRTDDDIWQSSSQAITYSLNITIRGALLSLPTPVKRNNQKILKPQFFEAFRQERENGELVDIASGYITGKAVRRSVRLEHDDELQYHPDDVQREGSVFGGILSKVVLATEMIPMLVKIQNLTDEPLLPVKVKPLSLKPYSFNMASSAIEELTSKDTEVDEDTYEEEAAGEDGLGIGGGRGWDLNDGQGDGEAGEEESGKAWLEDDDIQDWD